MVAALRSELLKLKRKKLFLIVFLIQALALFWLFAIVSQEKKEFLNWESLLSRLSMINALFLPIMIATIASRIIDFENKGNTWKLLCAISISRKLVYITKIIFSLFFLVYASMISISVIIVIGKFFNFASQIPVILLLKYGCFTIIGCIPMVILQLWISLVVKNQVFALMAGVIGSFLGYAGQMLSWKTWIIWTYSSLTNPISWAFSNGKIVFFPNQGVMMNLLLSLGVSLLFIILSTIHFSQKDIH
ncbi:ABC transporter permease [Bacillus cereus]|uniref:ABC transporter permease n=1 Tax=Bacillus cereus TaxID=1396 RepID=UPI001F270D1D|nr:ABC transporter permease [Bacillus cereus]MCU5716941.1 ABC transporter permease [Bacillus cereus]MDA1842793.1 ABC transporter permease [Bacillus cereus]BCB36108.1 ABC transporter permease [Bacillus cereus]BCB98919.1 ABC transporter permease [Bacillus cereus]BCC22417.1 ABC transporter permease [Bacillus cereus]